MERFLEPQRLELLQQGAQDSGDENWDDGQFDGKKKLTRRNGTSYDGEGQSHSDRDFLRFV
jgi:hypothetical protein